MVYNFWPNHYSSDQIIISALLISLGVLMMLEITAGYLILRKSIWPIDIISRKLNNNVILQNSKIEKSGLQNILDRIDSLTESDSGAKKTHENSRNNLAKMILNTLPVGIIALNRDQKIIASTRNAPISIMNDEKQIQLDFSGSAESLSDWFSRVSENDVRSQRIWTRIQDKKVTDENRKIFDVIANYERGATNGIEAIIITVDRTDDYVTDERDTDFVSMAAHELRTPITVIRGYLDVLEMQMADKITEDEKNSLVRIASAANSLSNYITNIMSVVRHEHETLKSSIIETSIDDIIDSIRDSAILNARAMRHSLEFSISKNLPTVAADISLVSQVLNNLIGNAIKYSPEYSKIIVRAKQIDPQFVEFSVQDFGFGISQPVAQDLFSKFHRNYKNNKSVQGVGFGLYLSRIIVKLHGGNIGVESIEGKGSTFTFTLSVFATYNPEESSPEEENTMIIKNHSRIMH